MMMEVSSPPEYARTIFSATRAPPLSRPEASGAMPVSHEQQQDGFLHVQAVFGLLEDERGGRVHHRVGHLLAPMGRQAVEEDGVRRRLRHQFRVHLVGREDFFPRGRLGLLPHAGPDVGVDRVSPAHRLLPVVGELDPAAGAGGGFAGGAGDVGGGLVAGGGGPGEAGGGGGRGAGGGGGWPGGGGGRGAPPSAAASGRRYCRRPRKRASPAANRRSA